MVTAVGAINSCQLGKGMGSQIHTLVINSGSSHEERHCEYHWKALRLPILLQCRYILSRCDYTILVFLHPGDSLSENPLRWARTGQHKMSGLQVLRKAVELNQQQILFCICAYLFPSVLKVTLSVEATTALGSLRRGVAHCSDCGRQGI